MLLGDAGEDTVERKERKYVRVETLEDRDGYVALALALAVVLYEPCGDLLGDDGDAATDELYGLRGSVASDVLGGTVLLLDVAVIASLSCAKFDRALGLDEVFSGGRGQGVGRVHLGTPVLGLKGLGYGGV